MDPARSAPLLIALGLISFIGVGGWSLTHSQGSRPESRPSESSPGSMNTEPLAEADGTLPPLAEALPLLESSQSLPGLARQALTHFFATDTILDSPQPLPREWQRSAGVFVTLSHNGKTRGCWGSLDTNAANLAEATIRAAIGAATRDWRYTPLKAEDLASVSIQVAIVQSVTPVSTIQELDPTRSGLFIRSGSRGAVLLPGEALTREWQLSTARRLAGIPPQEAVELYRVEAQLFHEFQK